MFKYTESILISKKIVGTIQVCCNEPFFTISSIFLSLHHELPSQSSPSFATVLYAEDQFHFMVMIKVSEDYLLLTLRSRVLLEKLTSFQLVKKFPAFYGTLRFITAFTSAHHLSLSRASSIQSTPPHPTS